MTPYDEYKLSLTPAEEKQIDETNKEILRRVLLKRLSQKALAYSLREHGESRDFRTLQSRSRKRHVSTRRFIIV